MKLEFHHINYVAEDVDRLHDFYTNILGLAEDCLTMYEARQVVYSTFAQAVKFDTRQVP